MFSKQDKILVFKLLGKHWSVLTTALSLPNSTDHDFFSACNCHNKHKTFLLVLYHLCHLSDQAKASSNLVLNTFRWCFEHIVSITKCFRVALNIALIRIEYCSDSLLLSTLNVYHFFNGSLQFCKRLAPLHVFPFYEFCSDHLFCQH